MREEPTPAEIVSELLAMPADERWHALDEEISSSLAIVLEAVLDEAEREADPLRRDDLADLGLRILDRLGEPPAQAREIEARLLCHRASAQQQRYAMRSSDATLDRASRLLARVPFDALPHARLCLTLGTLRAMQGRQDEALALLERSVRLFELHDDRQALGEALGSLGWARVQEPERAEPLFLDALALLDPATKSREAIAARLGLAFVCVLQGARPEEVERSLAEGRELYALLRSDRARAQAVWIEGAVHEAAGRLVEAEQCFRQAITSARTAGDSYFAVAVVFDLVRILLASGRRPALRALIQEPAQEFFSEDDLLDGRAHSVLRFVFKFLARQKVDPSQRLLLRATAFVKRCRWEPDAAFHPRSSPLGLVPWDQAPQDFRIHLCRLCGVDEKIAERSADELTDVARQLIGWTYEELTRFRIDFGEGQHE